MSKTYDYDAFGNEIAPAAGDGNPFRYCGEFWDNDAGTYYLRARNYDPTIGRFLTEDTHWNVGNMIYGDREYGEGEKKVADIRAINQALNLYAYCISNPVKFQDPSGRASYTNTIKNEGGGKYTVTTTISTWLGKISVTYIIDNGVIRFTFNKNNYWGVLWRGGGRTLAEAMLSAARSINSSWLSGRTVGGINAELQLHWAANFTGIRNAKVADMGGTKKGKAGYDSNAWFFESANAAQLLKKLISFYNPWDIYEALQDIGGYFG